jgi:hypothetical protein
MQEVCELTPGKILTTGTRIFQYNPFIHISYPLVTVDPERGAIWERELRKYLPGYVQLQSHQLVGLLLCLYVKEEIVANVRDIQYEITKV